MNRTHKNRLIAGTVAVATAVGICGGAGAANAEDTLGKLDDHSCQGVSPNIVDLPYVVTIHALQQQQPIIHNNVDLYLSEPVTLLAPYQVTGTLTWRSPVTGQHGSQAFTDSVPRHQFLMPFSSRSDMPELTLHPGVGPLDVTVKAQPKGAVPVAPVTCTVRFDVI
ncbi:hypothetical protein ACLQ3C_17590 [Gordonia sp. DT30]|uniref:hypothetical protein n=1 Tax=unclassified Gordonia (in: high G+C Gram-positive bacteria) TaxID=2657482 RepID=UPI003CE82A3C